MLARLVLICLLFWLKLEKNLIFYIFIECWLWPLCHLLLILDTKFLKVNSNYTHVSFTIFNLHYFFLCLCSLDFKEEKVCPQHKLSAEHQLVPNTPARKRRSRPHDDFLHFKYTKRISWAPFLSVARFPLTCENAERGLGGPCGSNFFLEDRVAGDPSIAIISSVKAFPPTSSLFFLMQFTVGNNLVLYDQELEYQAELLYKKTFCTKQIMTLNVVIAVEKVTGPPLWGAIKWNVGI